jgi:hypothetical protein
MSFLTTLVFIIVLAHPQFYIGRGIDVFSGCFFFLYGHQQVTLLVSLGFRNEFVHFFAPYQLHLQMSSKSPNFALNSFLGFVENIPFISTDQMNLMNILRIFPAFLSLWHRIYYYGTAISLVQINKIEVGSKF